MPWSDWQEYGVAERGAPRLTLTFSTQYGNSAAVDQNPSEVYAYLMPEIDRHSRIGYQWSLPYGWQDWRDQYPPLLDSMVEGVGYGPNPDTGDVVEYEPGVSNTHVGWRTPRLWLSQAYAMDLPDVNDHTWQAGLLTGTSYTAGDIGGWPGTGSVFATGTAFTPPDGTDLAAPADPGPVPTITVLADILTTDGTQAYLSLRSRADALALIRLPRFRYWIPDGDVSYPIRQKQRNDGLGRGVVRARSTSSVQNSIRQRSYR